MYVYIAIALAAALSAGFGTWRVQDWRYAAKDLERQEQADKERARKLDKADTGAVAHEKDKAELRTEFIVITEKVEHVLEDPTYDRLCFTDAGLQLLQSAVSGSQTTSLPAPTVPRSSTAK